MAANGLTLYNSFFEYLGDGTIDLDADTFAVLLTTSTYTPAATHSQISDITNEVSGNGYSRQTLGSVTWTQSGGTATFDAADTVFTASGGSIVARYYVLFDDTVTSPVTDALIGYGLLDNTPADITITDGNTGTLQWNASGLFTSTQA